MREHGFDLDARDERPLRPLRRRQQRPAVGGRRRLRGGDSALRAADVAGWRAMQDVMRRLRDALRPAGERDIWIGEPPTREQLEDRIGDDERLRGLLFEWSMAEFVERYLADERLQIAYLGQGVIGTNASPFDKGTAYIHFHHSAGRLDGYAGVWGYVHGGMGQVSFILCDIARELGAVVAAGVPVASILPGEGVRLADGAVHPRACRREQRRSAGDAAPARRRS